MTVVSNKQGFQDFLNSEALPKLLAMESTDDFKKSGVSNTYEYSDDTNTRTKGVVLFQTPQQGTDENESDRYIEVTKLYGNLENPFRVSGIELYEDVFDQRDSITLQDFKTLGDAVEFAFVADGLLSFDVEEIQNHLAGNGTVKFQSRIGDDLKSGVIPERKRPVPDDGPSR